MATLTPVEGDPFAAGAAARVVPIDGDPFKGEAVKPSGPAKYVTDIWPETKERLGSYWQGVKSAAVDIAPSATGEQPGQWDRFTAPARLLANAAGLPLSFIEGPARSVVGHGLADTIQAIGSVIAPDIAAKQDPQALYEQSKEDVSTSLAALAPGRRGLPALRNPPVPPVNPVGNGPLGVTLSEGQATGALPAIQREQGALRNTAAPGHQRAQQFNAQQQAEVVDARDLVARGLDRFGNRVAETPQEAGDVVQRGLQTEARNQRAGIDQGYADARAAGGELDIRVFNDLGTGIRRDLFRGNNPVVIDAQTTPLANNALRDVDNAVNSLRQSTGTTGVPTGIDLAGVDQVRQRLNSFYRQAQAGSPDSRAMRRIIDEFDGRIDTFVNSPMFTGSPDAVNLWNSARAANTQYRRLFGRAGTNDPVGRQIQKILGDRNSPAAIPNDVADFIYGGGGTNPNTLNVATARRIRDILGDASPEWSAVKQGVFARLTETPQGMTNFGPGRIAQRLNDFLSGNGQEMARLAFSPVERTLLQQYADLHRALEVPQAGANWSNTATFLAPILQRISHGLGAVIGGVIGHMFTGGASMGAGEGIGALIGARALGTVREFRDARQIARQMPLVIEAAQRFQRSLAAYNRLNSPPSSAALQVAANNLVRQMKNIGVDIAQAEQSDGGQKNENRPQAEAQ